LVFECYEHLFLAIREENLREPQIATPCFCESVANSCLASNKSKPYLPHLHTEGLGHTPDTVLFIKTNLEDHLK